MSQYHVGGLLLALAAALLSGFVGAAIVFWFLAKFLVREDEVLDPADYDMIGVLGKVSSTIRSDGIGEIIYSRDGARRSAAARSDEGGAVPSGVEVIVTRYENGIAYVRRWEDMAGSEKSF